MPYLDFPSENVRIWYRTNLPDDNLQHLDRNRPTAVFLHGMVMDSTFFDLQFNDSRLNGKLNMVAFDSRSAGRTKNPLDPTRDTWTEAADYAKTILLLKLPACHLFAAGAIAQRAAIHLACLCPYLCLSICWVGLRISKEPDWMAPTYEELMKLITEAEDIEAVEDAAHEIMYYLLGENLQDERRDQFAGYVATQYTGCNSPRLYDYQLVATERDPVDPAEMQLVKQPVMSIQGSFSPLYGSEAPISLQKLLVNAAMVELHTVNGPVYTHAVESSAQTVNTLFLEFVERATSKAPHSEPPPPFEDAMSMALSKQARILNFEALHMGDPLLSSAFSRISSDQRKTRAALLARVQDAAKSRSTARILDPAGRPIRKYTERYNQVVRKPVASGMAAGSILVTASEIVVE